MSAHPEALDVEHLARRLRELAGEERHVQVEFLLHLDEFDRRRAFLDAGYRSLWEYCLRALHLREGPAGRRIGAMRVLRRLPALEAPLRDGRLCLSTVTLLGPLLTEKNQDDLVARAALRTKAEVQHLVASLQPRVAPREGVRRIATPTSTPTPTAAATETSTETSTETESATPTETSSSTSRPRARAEVDAVSSEAWSLRVTIDAELKADLETLTNLLAHKTGRDVTAVLRGRCGARSRSTGRGGAPCHPPESGGRAPRAASRRQPPPPTRPRAARRNARNDRAPRARFRPPSAAEVWERDGGRCAFVAADGRRCGSRWKLEVDHVHPFALGGTSTRDNLRLLCKAHNLRHAEQTLGADRMARFTHPGMSERPAANEAAPQWHLFA